MNSHASSAIENGLTSQLTPDGRRDAAPVLPHLPERAEVDLEQHRHDHQPDQHRDRQVDLRHRRRAEHMEHAGIACPSTMPATMQSATHNVR